MGRKKIPEPIDQTAWLIDSSLAEFLLMHTYEIKYMAMFGYAFYHGVHLFDSFPSSASTSYKFVSMILKCTGGGILVPLFLNLIPFPLIYDAYAIAVLAAFSTHNYFPIIREVYHLSPILKVSCIILYECLRAYVVVYFTQEGAARIPASNFSVPIFGPIFCGAIGGCGYKFIPLNQGLAPLEKGLQQPMLSALLGATFFHAWMNLSGVPKADDKGHVIVAVFFIAYNLSSTMRKGAKAHGVKDAATAKKTD